MHVLCIYFLFTTCLLSQHYIHVLNLPVPTMHSDDALHNHTFHTYPHTIHMNPHHTTGGGGEDLIWGQYMGLNSTQCIQPSFTAITVTLLLRSWSGAITMWPLYPGDLGPVVGPMTDGICACIPLQRAS
jgi:hypothetical protein